MGRTGMVIPAGRGRTGTFGDGVSQGGEFAARLGEEIRRLIVLNMREEPQIGGIEPGLPPMGAPALGELAEGLVNQAEVDAVLAAGIGAVSRMPM